MTPELTIEFAFGYGPLDDVPTSGWTDVTIYVEALVPFHGRSNELDTFSAGTCALQLVNDDRRFDPLHAAGPHFGELLPGVPMRVTSTSGAAVWRGFADGFECVPGTFSGTAVVPCTDAFQQFATAQLPLSVYESVILADSPRAYFKLGSASGERLTDSSPNRFDGTWGPNAQRGQAPVVPYSIDGSAKSSVANTIVGQIDNAALVLPDMTLWSVEFWFQADQVDGGNAAERFLDGDTIGANRGFRIVGFSGTASLYGGEVIIRVFDQPYLSYFATPTLFDAKPHHVVVVYTGSVFGGGLALYIDGTNVGLTEVIADVVTAGFSGRFIIGPRFGASDVLSGRIDDLAIYDYALTLAQVEEHYMAGTAPWDGDSTGARIERVLDMIGWPAALRSIDNGEFLVGPARLDGRFSLDYLQSIANSEQGRLFIDAAGRVVFHQRGRSLTEATETTSQFTFDDDPETGILIDPSLRFSLDRTYLYNEAKVTRDSGETQTVRDEPSIAQYGPRTRSIDGLALRDDRDSRALAEYIVGRYKEPQTRSTAWTVQPDQNPSTWPTLLALEIGHRIALELTPQGVGDPAEVELHLESIRHEITTDGDWLITYTGSPVDSNVYFTFDGDDTTQGFDAGVFR